MTKDALQRIQYEKAIKQKSQTAVQVIKELRKTDTPGDAVKAWETAEETSKFREAQRAATREKISAPSRALSEVIDKTQPTEAYAKKYSSPPEIRTDISKGVKPLSPEGAYVYEVAEDVAKGAGKSRSGLGGFALKSGRYLGPLGIAIGGGLSAREIYSAPEGQKGPTAAREIGSFSYSLIGAAAGGQLALVVAAILIGASPVGWVAFGVAAVGALVGGYLFGTLGATTGENLYGLF